jgi:methionyl-tRNA formyltransferase
MLGLNRLGESVYEFLTAHDETKTLGVFTEESQYAVIEQLAPEYLISAGFDHIVPEHVLESVDHALNLHPSYLPYNRGVNPDIWSIVRPEPAGVSIHYMTPEMDAGPLVARERVDIKPDDTGRTLRKRLDSELVDLFIESWEDIYTGNVETVEQNSTEGTYNYSNDFEDLCQLDLEETKAVGDVIDELRALTFPPYHNACFVEDEVTYYLRLSIVAEDAIESENQEWDTPTLF